MFQDFWRSIRKRLNLLYASIGIGGVSSLITKATENHFLGKTTACGAKDVYSYGFPFVLREYVEEYQRIYDASGNPVSRELIKRYNHTDPHGFLANVLFWSILIGVPTAITWRYMKRHES